MIKTIWYLIKIFFTNKHHHKFAIAMGSSIVVLSLFLVYISYLFNSWRKGFWDAVEHLDKIGFLHGIGEFTILAFIYIFAYAFLTYLSQTYCLRWRKNLTYVLVEKWYKLYDKNSVENPDQRLQMDLDQFTTGFQRFFLDILNAIALVCVFGPVLWNLSTSIVISDMHIPGYFLWIAIAWAIIGSSMSYLVGRKLPRLNYANQSTEADFRYKLVQIRQNKPVTKLKLFLKFNALYQNHMNLYRYIKYFNLFSTSYNQINIILPVLAAFPLLLSKTLTMGTLMQTLHAFDSVSSSLSYVVLNYTAFCDFASTLRRLEEFIKKLDNLNE